MKTAISGKGGVGDVLLTTFLSHISVIVIDASPDFNLATTPVFPHPDKFTPILELNDLIEECAGVHSGASDSLFKLNPKENYSVN
jgi:CO dehydrogenase nickel-insertion accessory protein CooC1